MLFKVFVWDVKKTVYPILIMMLAKCVHNLHHYTLHHEFYGDNKTVETPLAKLYDNESLIHRH